MWKEDRKIDAWITFGLALFLAGALVIEENHLPSGVDLFGVVAFFGLMAYSFKRAGA